MSEFLDKNPEEQDDLPFVTQAKQADSETSTIFSAPKEHKNEKATTKGTLIRRILCYVLAVAILGGATYGIWRLVPKKEKEEVSAFKPFDIIANDTTQIDSIEIKHEFATLNLTSKMSENEKKESVQVWTLEGFDNSLIEQSLLSTLADCAANLTANSQYDFDEKADYGFENPTVTVDVKGEKLNTPYIVTYGKQTADGGYYYAKVSTIADKVYLVATSSASAFLVKPLDLAITSSIPAVLKTSANGKYFDDEGNLYSFDTITVSGNNFASEIVFKPNDDDKFTSYATYITTAPQNRVATKVDELLKLFANGLACSGSVSFDQSDAALKLFGLDKPDAKITLKLGNETYTYSFTKAKDIIGTYYVVGSTDRMIRTVTTTNIGFVEYKETDFYTPFMVLESISEVSRFTLSGEVNHSFDIVKGETEKTYNITVDGKEIEAEKFQNFYAEFISTGAIDFTVTNTSAKPDLTIVLEHTNGEPPTKLTYTKISDSRYQYTVGNVPMGQITSSAYKRIVKTITNVAQGE